MELRVFEGTQPPPEKKIYLKLIQGSPDNVDLIMVEADGSPVANGTLFELMIACGELRGRKMCNVTKYLPVALDSEGRILDF